MDSRLVASLLVCALMLECLCPVDALTPFQATRYGKRQSTNQQQQAAAAAAAARTRASFYANRYGRSGGLLAEQVPRSSRFIPGTRYGKRSQTMEETVDSNPVTLLLGESTVCLLIEQPDLYRCTRAITTESEEDTSE